MQRLHKIGKLLPQMLRLMVGIPDYETYLRHMALMHPDEGALSKADFYRNRTDRRYGGGSKGISRCC